MGSSGSHRLFVRWVCLAGEMVGEIAMINEGLKDLERSLEL